MPRGSLESAERPENAADRVDSRILQDALRQHPKFRAQFRFRIRHDNLSLCSVIIPKIGLAFPPRLEATYSPLSFVADTVRQCAPLRGGERRFAL